VPPTSTSLPVHGAKSAEATHWIEVRAVVARIAADHALSARLWLTAARFHSSSARRDLPSTRTCLDHAYREWYGVTDEDVIDELASALRAMCQQDPYYSTEMLAALDRRLLHKTVHSRQEFFGRECLVNGGSVDHGDASRRL
jgi:hypothetical protein